MVRLSRFRGPRPGRPPTAAGSARLRGRAWRCRLPARNGKGYQCGNRHQHPELNRGSLLGHHAEGDDEDLCRTTQSIRIAPRTRVSSGVSSSVVVAAAAALTAVSGPLDSVALQQTVKQVFGSVKAEEQVRQPSVSVSPQPAAAKSTAVRPEPAAFR